MWGADCSEAPHSTRKGSDTAHPGSTSRLCPGLLGPPQSVLRSDHSFPTCGPNFLAHLVSSQPSAHSALAHDTSGQGARSAMDLAEPPDWSQWRSVAPKDTPVRRVSSGHLEGRGVLKDSCRAQIRSYTLSAGPCNEIGVGGGGGPFVGCRLGGKTPPCSTFGREPGCWAQGVGSPPGQGRGFPWKAGPHILPHEAQFPTSLCPGVPRG